MKLSNAVLGIVKGLGAVAIAASVGCAAQPPPVTGAEVAARKPENVVRVEPTPTVEPHETVTPVSESQPVQADLDEIPAPCGRG